MRWWMVSKHRIKGVFDHISKLIRSGVEEARFIRSFSDAKIFFNQKLPFIMSRVTKYYAWGSKVPPTLQLEPTNYCNLRCICCPVDRMSRKKGYLDYDLFQKIIDEASQIGTKRIHLYLQGEPLLHPQIVEMISYIKRKDLGLNLTTNGMQLDRDKIKSILHSGVNSSDYITFSLLGHSREIHEKIMIGVNHDRVIDNIHQFMSLRNELKLNGPIIQVVLYQMPENTGEVKDFIDDWRGKVDHVVTVGAIVDKFASHGRQDNDCMPLRTRTCNLLWERMTVYWNGDVTLCALDVDGDHILGSLKNKSIKEIWNSQQLLSVKRKHRARQFDDLSFCARCDQ